MRSASGALRPPTPRDPDTPHLVGRGYAPDAPRRIFRDGIANQAPDQEPSGTRSEEHTSELQSLMRISYAVFCLKKKNNPQLVHRGYAPDTPRKIIRNSLATKGTYKTKEGH